MPLVAFTAERGVPGIGCGVCWGCCRPMALVVFRLGVDVNILRANANPLLRPLPELPPPPLFCCCCRLHLATAAPLLSPTVLISGLEPI